MTRGRYGLWHLGQVVECWGEWYVGGEGGWGGWGVGVGGVALAT